MNISFCLGHSLQWSSDGTAIAFQAEFLRVLQDVKRDLAALRREFSVSARGPEVSAINGENEIINRVSFQTFFGTLFSLFPDNRLTKPDRGDRARFFFCEDRGTLRRDILVAFLRGCLTL